jgi:GntR family transcriptional regulator
MSNTAPRRLQPAPTLQVDMSSPTPPYEQLREQIAGLIATGGLQAGERLPPVRQLAADLGLASGTVARSYQELEQAGLVEGRGRHGTIVQAATGAGAGDQSRHLALSAAADNLAGAARELGLSDEAALAAVRSALARLRTQQA